MSFFSQVSGNLEVHPVDHEIVASYSWFEDESVISPKVCIPGYAPILVRDNLFETFVLLRDERESSCHDQAQRKYEALMEVVFKSIEQCSPAFELNDVDIVTDRYILHELLRFCGSPGCR